MVYGHSKTSLLSVVAAVPPQKIPEHIAHGGQRSYPLD